jgi:hypothetical protein
VRPKEVSEPGETHPFAWALTHDPSWRGRLVILADDVAAELNAFITDEDARAGDELPHLVLTLTAKAAARGAAPIGHAESIGGVM